MVMVLVVTTKIGGHIARKTLKPIKVTSEHKECAAHHAQKKIQGLHIIDTKGHIIDTHHTR